MIDLIVQCAKAIFYFLLILAYFIVSATVFFAFQTTKKLEPQESDFSDAFWAELQQVSTWMSGGFDFTDD